jgi:Lamin Tail Domain
MKKILFVLGLFVLIPKFVHASLEITEIMYDPKGANTNHQWIEVYNNGSSSVSIDALKWRFNDGASHYLNNKVDFSVPASSYFILTGDKNAFMADHANFTGTVIDTVMALDKDNGNVSIINDGTTVDGVAYSLAMGASEDGNSLQKSGSSWIAALPTPGVATVSDTSNLSQVFSGSGSGSSSSSNGSSVSIPKKEVAPPKINTEIIAKNIVIAGIDFKVDQKTTGYNKESLYYGRSIWNFGDGMSREISNQNSPFLYRYDYPGEYLMTLSYSRNYYGSNIDATDRMIIKVIPASVVVSSIGPSTDPYVELENKSPYETDLSNWSIKGKNNYFNIPDGTLILSGKKIKLSPRVTKFNADDLNNLSIVSPSGEVVSSYPYVDNTVNQKESLVDVKVPNKTQSVSRENNTEKILPTLSLVKKEKYNNVINLNDMTASADSARTRVSWPIFGFISILVVAVSAVYSLRYLQNHKHHEEGLENPINARDIDIIE